MPLPTSGANTPWPPKNLAQAILPKMQEWSAWYSADLGKLQEAYGGGPIADSTGFFASDGGGFKPNVGRRMVRWFVGQPSVGPDRNMKLPMPIAGEIAQASADLMFSDPPTFIVKNKPTQARLDELADDHLFSTLAQAAEICAALGGAFLKVGWDTTVYSDRPFVSVVDADRAAPEFAWGKLSAVTFWQTLAREGQTVWRHLERHELDSFGVGVIIHGLFEGTVDTLGIRVGLDSRPETTPLFVLTEDSAVAGMISSDSPGLCVVYVPNVLPNRQWRNDPVGRYLGRSDYDGVEHLLDQYSETMTDWMRARRAAKARVMVDKTLMLNPGPGQGAVVNLDQEVYTSVAQVTTKDATLADRVQVLQPSFNVQQYQITAETIIEQILQSIGYSMQTFGVGDTGTVRTATEIESRERRTLMTRARKIREWSPAISELLVKLMQVDNAIFGGTNIADSVYIEFPDSVQETQLALAQTVQTLYAGESASLHERVNILHPDWTDDQVNAEVALIQKETVNVQDPMALPPTIPEQGEPGGPSAT